LVVLVGDWEAFLAVSSVRFSDGGKTESAQAHHLGTISVKFVLLDRADGLTEISYGAQ
jgi:hypothetical protein